MNFIKFQCSCGQSIEAPAEGEGEKIPCPSCGKEIQIPYQPFKMPWRLIILIGVFVLALLVVPPIYERTQLIAKLKDHTAANLVSSGDLFETAKNGISEKLLSPKTAQFGSAWVTIEDNDAFIHFDEVDSQNQYGALVRSEWGLVLHHDHYESSNFTNDFWIARKVICLSGTKGIVR
jgi:hypothetical protein